MEDDRCLVLIPHHHQHRCDPLYFDDVIQLVLSADALPIIFPSHMFYVSIILIKSCWTLVVEIDQNLLK